MSDFQSKILEVKGLLTEVNELIDKQKISLNNAADAIAKYSKSAKLPSDYVNAQKEVNRNLEKQTELQKRIDQNAKNQTYAIQKLTKEELSYTQSIERAIKTKEKELLANEKLSRSYVQLTANRNLEKQTELQKRIEQNAKNQTYAIQKLTKEELSYTQSIERAIKTKEKELLANEKLSRSYVQLTANREKAKNKLQDLIASETASNKEIKQAQKEFDVLNKKVAQADKAIGKFSQANSGIKALTSSVGSLMGAFGIGTGIYLAVDIVKGIYDITKALQSQDLALKMVSETELEFAKNQQFVTEVADKWGLEIKDLQKTYTQFYTASKGLLSDESIKTTFEGIAKAGSIMGLSLESQNAAFYAFDQMMSKGTVTAEELKKQLGNAMPGAIKAAAMAYMELHPQIKSIQEAEKALYEDMKKGAIDSATYVPLIAKNFQILYGIESINSVHTMQSAQNRLQNSWTEWVRGLSSGGTGLKIIVSVMESLAKNLSTIITTLTIGVTGWLAYKTAVMLANAQTKLLALTTTTATVVTTEQTVATGLQTTAQLANAEATAVATTATRTFNSVIKANALGLIIAGLYLAYEAFSYLTKSVEETTAAVKEKNTAFIKNREITTEAIIDTNSLIKTYNDLSKKINLSKEEQLKLNNATQELAKIVPSAVIGVNQYGQAIKLNSDTLIKYNAEKSKQLELERKVAIQTERESIGNQVKDIEAKQKILNNLKKYKGKGSVTQELIDQQELALSIAKQELIMSSGRLVSLKGETEAEKQTVIDSKKLKEKEIKNIEWYDKKISELEKTKEGFTKRGEGLEYQKQLKQLQKERAYILGEEEKEIKAREKDEEEELKKIEENNKLKFELKLAQLEKEKQLLEEQTKNEKLSYSERLAFAFEVAQKEMEIAIANNEEEIRLANNEEEIRLANNEEEIRLAKEHSEKLKIADIKFWKEKEKLAKEAVDRINNIVYEPQYKDRSKLADAEQYGEGTYMLEQDNMDVLVSGYNKHMSDVEKAEKERIERLKEIRDLLNDSFKEFGKATGFEKTVDVFLKIGKDGKSMFEKLTEGGEENKATWEEWGLAVSTVAQDAFNLIENASQMRFDRERNRLQAQYETQLKYTGDNKAAQEKLALDLEKRKKEIDVREAKAKKKQAIFNIAIDTAQAIMSVIAKGGKFWEGAVVAALGAVQAGLVASQKIPQYWRGTDNAQGGLAWTQEKGQEVITDKKGNIKDFGDNKGARLTMLEAGDKVFTAEKTKQMLFNNEYHDILASNSILPPKIEVNSKGITAEEMKAVLSETLGEMPIIQTNIDAFGFDSFMQKGNSRTKRIGSKISSTGISV